MKRQLFWMLLCILPLTGVYAYSADELAMAPPFAFQDRFQDGSQRLGFPEGKRLQLGCFITAANAPIKKVVAKNLNTGVTLSPSPLQTGVWSGMYLVFPFPQFEPEKHVGVWEISVEDEQGRKVTARTHRLDDFGELPYVKEIKATGSSLSPLVSWKATDREDIPENISIKYQIRLLTGIKNQLHKSKEITETHYQIPADLIKPENASKVFIRIDTLGYDKTDTSHPMPFEMSSRTFIPLNEAITVN